MSLSSELVENTIRQHLAEHDTWRQLAQDAPEIYAAVERTLLAPGKRLRPRLFMLASSGYGMQSEQIIRQVSLALELAHAFVLMHDDLIDKASHRRGIPTIGRDLDDRWPATSLPSFKGNDIALVLGDLIYTLAIEALCQTGTSEEKTTVAIGMLTRAAQATACGALREIAATRSDPARISLADLYETYRLKTAFYTFKLPMQLGALFADQTSAVMAAIEAFANEAGLAFQLRNDLEPLQDWLAGGALPDDIREMRMTAALLHVWKNCVPGDRACLMQGDSQTMRGLFDSCGVLDWLAQEISHHIALAAELVPPLGLSPSAGTRLLELLATI